MASLRGVSKRFGDELSLDSIDLDIGAGLTALYGPTGAGKTTLLHLLAGLDQPSEGAILHAPGVTTGFLVCAMPHPAPGRRFAALDRADLVLADDPTHGLPRRLALETCHSLRAIAASSAVVISTHRDDLRGLADQGLWMRDGRVLNPPTIVSGAPSGTPPEPPSPVHLRSSEAVPIVGVTLPDGQTLAAVHHLHNEALGTHAVPVLIPTMAYAALATAMEDWLTTNYGPRLRPCDGPFHVGGQVLTRVGGAGPRQKLLDVITAEILERWERQNR